MTTTFSPAELKALGQRFNSKLIALSAPFYENLPLQEVLAIVNSDPEFVPAVTFFPTLQRNVVGNSGQTTVQLAPEVWFHLSWYRFETGTFEINSYVTTEQDDYREPYTTVFKGNAKKRAKDAANGLLVSNTSNKYFDTKTAAHAVLVDALRSADLDVQEFVESALPNDEGRLTVSVGNDLFLNVTWYRMGSGRYEIVAYVS